MTDEMQHLTDQSAERAVLGAILVNNEAMIDIGATLLPADFSDEIHNWIYSAMLDLQIEHAPMDYVSVCDKLQQVKRLEKIGGAAYLTQMIGDTPTSMHADRYAMIVQRLSTLRKLIGAAGGIAKLAYTAGNTQIDDVFSKARQLIDRATPLQNDDSVLMWLRSLDAFVTGQMERGKEADLIAAGTAVPRVEMPWKAVSRFIRNVRPGMLMTIAAGSSVGKTTMMECLAEFWAKAGLRVVFFHLELSHQFMLDRRMVRQSGESLELVEDGETTEKMRAASEKMRNWAGGINYVHCPGWSAYQIVQKARQLNMRGECDVMIVDYFQKLRLGYRSGQNKADVMGNAAEGLKNGCEQMGIAGVTGSQFNKAARFEDRKTADSIRGSGEIAEKSNVVITLDREILDNIVYDDRGMPVALVGERSPVVKVRVDKNTAGPTGDCELVMNAKRFLMLDRQGV